MAKVFNKDFHKNLKELDDELSANLGNLNPAFQKKYKLLTSQMTNFYNNCSQMILQIGQLQILRKLITKQIFFSARVESSLYQSCLETLNYTVLNNIDEIKESAKRTFVDRDDELAMMNSETLN